MKSISLFTAPGCSSCRVIANLLRSNRKDFDTIDTGTPEGLAELLCTAPGEMALPVLVISKGLDDVHIFPASVLLDGETIRPGPWMGLVGI